MDTKFAAIAGALQDLKIIEHDKLVVLDVGNGHTLSQPSKKEKSWDSWNTTQKC